MTPIFDALVQQHLDQLFEIWMAVSHAGDPHGVLPTVDNEIERWIVFRQTRGV